MDTWPLAQAEHFGSGIVGGVGAVLAGLLALCALLGLATLLLNQRTRKLGYVLVTLASAAAVLIAVELVAWQRVSRSADIRLREMVERDAAQAMATRLIDSPGEIPLHASGAATSAADATSGPLGGAEPEPYDAIDDPSAPDWVTEPSRMVGSTYVATAQTDYCFSERECRTALDAEMVALTKEYLEQLHGRGAGELVTVDVDYIHEHILQQQYLQVLGENSGPIWRGYAELRFDEEVHRYLDSLYAQAELQQRLYSTAHVALLVLAVLGAVYFYLKLDTATRGYWTWRLKFAATLVILAILGAGYATRYEAILGR